MYFKVTKEEIDRIFHLIGNKVPKKGILDFMFQSPFRFHLDDKKETYLKILREIENETFQSMLNRPIGTTDHTFSEFSHEESDQSSSPSRLSMKFGNRSPN